MENEVNPNEKWEWRDAHGGCGCHCQSTESTTLSLFPRLFIHSSLSLLISSFLFQRIHGFRCCSGSIPPNAKPKQTQTPELLKIVVTAATEILRIFIPAAPRYAPPLSLSPPYHGLSNEKNKFSRRIRTIFWSLFAEKVFQYPNSESTLHSSAIQ